MLNSTHVEGTLVDGVLVARLKCEKLGEYEASIVQNDLAAAAKGVAWKVALDFTDVQLISSVGLGLIVSLNKTAKNNKGRLSLFNLSANLINLFKITRLDSGLLIKPDQESAIKAVS
jgi:anti-anti-sigma factor